MYLQARTSDFVRNMSACMSGSEDSSGNIAHKAVSTVELELLGRGWPVGAPLGSLREVQAALGLGLPSCREAINILEARGLLQIKCGRGGGLFVSLPPVDDVASIMLVYLSFHTDIPDCIGSFRRVVWKMIAETAINRDDPPLGADMPFSGKGFAVDLARRLENPTMVFAAELAEALIKACEGPPPPAEDKILETALRSRDREGALRRIEELVDAANLAMPAIKLEALENRLLRFKGKSAIVLAARMAQEFGTQTSESEWETATRLGYSDGIVRQARRILQDFGVMQCQQGKKGGLWAMPVAPAGVIRLLAACLVANGMDERAYRDAATFFECNMLPFAARRAALLSEKGTLLAQLKGGRSRIDMLRTDNLVLHMNGNPLLAVFFRAVGLAQLFVGDAPPVALVPNEAAKLNRRFLKAIELGDSESAACLASEKMKALKMQFPRHRGRLKNHDSGAGTSTLDSASRALP